MTVKPPALYYRDGPELLMGVSTDPAFTQRAAHELRLRLMHEKLMWHYADSRCAALRLMNQTRPHLVYFYCHGGWDSTQNIPFLQFGPTTEYGITPDNLGYPDIRWESPRPLVFINGCHTTALEPQKAMQFIGAFVEHANASGVIGTEITIFEPLPCSFAEEFFGRLIRGANVGDATRGARLALLKKRNPLGLAYIPFVIGSLQLIESGKTDAADGRH